jgi:PHD/YefM family antitoxin component YafN of YafNO toxin-antitoxin module
MKATEKERFIVDQKGKRRAVVLDIEDYRRLLEDLEDLRVIAERKSESSISLKELEKRLKKHARL